MSWQLRDGLHYAVSGGAGIFLDVPAGRYFALPPRLDDALRAALGGDAIHSDSHALAILEQRAILVRAAGPVSGLDTPRLPSRDRQGRGRARLSLVVRAATERQRALRDVRRRPVSELAAGLAGIPRASARRGLAALDAFDVAAAFQRLGDVLPTRDQCLPETLAFVRICRHAGIEVEAILGVCAAPFAAHCWAQSGETLLNDRLDRVVMFTPIVAW